MEKKKKYLGGLFNVFSTSLTKIIIMFINVLLEVIKGPAYGFLVIVALLAFKDNLRQNSNVNRCRNNEQLN